MYWVITPDRNAGGGRRIGAAAVRSDHPAHYTMPKIPAVTGPIPRTETSIPIGAAYFPGAPGSVNLADYGYVEDEYFLSGTANVYQYDASGKNVEVKTPNVPYTTVILVRHPADPRKFSGRVQLEMSHPQFGVTTQVWAHNYKMFMADGDAWVRVTTSRGGPTGSSIGVAKQYNPTRYASLNVPEDGLNWDIIGQVAELLRSNVARSPLAGFPVKQIFMEGFSGAGAIVQFWINDMSRILRQSDGQFTHRRIRGRRAERLSAHQLPSGTHRRGRSSASRHPTRRAGREAAHATGTGESASPRQRHRRESLSHLRSGGCRSHRRLHESV
jgi:alpha/beta hydrolase family protein